MITWSNEPASRGEERYSRRHGGKMELTNEALAIRTPRRIQRDSPVLRELKNELRHAGINVIRLSETSNPFLPDQEKMIAIRPPSRAKFEQFINEHNYQCVFIDKAQFRFHPYGSPGHYVVIPDDWTGNWPPRED